MVHLRHQLRLRAGLSAATCIVVCSGVCAQQAATQQPSPQTASSNDQSQSNALTEVIVTATRRTASLQSVPMSITAVTAADLQQSAADNFFDYASGIPNLSFGYAATSSDAGFANSRQVAIRGIAGDGTTGFYIDDTPVPASIDPEVVDVTRVEVLRGPQGTLYGALSMGGTVRVITDQPDSQTFSALGHASLAGTDHAEDPDYKVDGTVNIPLVEGKLALRVTGVRDDDAGYFKRDVESDDQTIDNVAQRATEGGQVALVWQPTEDLSITPRVLYQHTLLNGLPFSTVTYNASSLSPIFIDPTSFVQPQLFDIPESASDQWTLFSLDLKETRSFGTFVFTSSYFKRHTTDTEDQTLAISQIFGIAPIPTSIEDESNPRYQTDELRFASSFSGPVQLVAGLYYQHLNTSGLLYPPDYIPGLNAAVGGAFGTDLLFSQYARNVQIEKAPYTEITYDVTKNVRATVGIRKTWIETIAGPFTTEGVFGSPPVAQTDVTQSVVTPKYSLQYLFSSDNQIYTTVAKGFRPGSEEVLSAPGPCAAQLTALGYEPGALTVTPDSVWSYEIGGKTSWLDRRVIVNVDVFRIDWSQIQQNVTLPCGESFLANAGDARSQGGELDIDAAITGDLTFEFSGGIDDATFTETSKGTVFEPGNRIPQVPRESFQVALNYSHDISDMTAVFGHLDYRNVGDSWSTNNAITNPATGSIVPLIRPAYRILDLRGGIRYRSAEYALFIKNVTNEIANLSDTYPVSIQPVGIARVAVNQPRTIGAEVIYRLH
jgi:iron complex outermembrane recepter protein